MRGRVIATLGALLVAAGGCGGSSSPGSRTVVATGHVVLLGGDDVVQMSHDGSCWGIGRYTSYATGTSVVVSTGGSRRSGPLQRSAVVTNGSGTLITGCRFEFRVSGVPAGHDRYTVAVAGTRRSIVAADLDHGITVQVRAVPR